MEALRDINKVYSELDQAILKNTQNEERGLSQISSEELKSLPEEFVKSYIDVLSEYTEIISQQTEHLDICNKTHLDIWLFKHGLKMAPGFGNQITEDILIEIYNLENQQLFRSVNFFNFSSYSVHELTFIPWDKLYFRRPEFTAEMENEIKRVLVNQIPATKPRVTPHFLDELKTGKRFKYEAKDLGCIYSNTTGEVAGYIALISIRHVPAGVQLLQ
ncbi:MAG: hypothetical protein VXV96_11455 [Bdellovibrionota bacterium]|jgi:hypothetical protein|nr:hypothetical protein [Bdellovibrionota bacterium]